MVPRWCICLSGTQVVYMPLRYPGRCIPVCLSGTRVGVSPVYIPRCVPRVVGIPVVYLRGGLCPLCTSEGGLCPFYALFGEVLCSVSALFGEVLCSVLHRFEQKCGPQGAVCLSPGGPLLARVSDIVIRSARYSHHFEQKVVIQAGGDGVPER